jgi:hypothetical protein
MLRFGTPHPPNMSGDISGDMSGRMSGDMSGDMHVDRHGARHRTTVKISIYIYIYIYIYIDMYIYIFIYIHILILTYANGWPTWRWATQHQPVAEAVGEAPSLVARPTRWDPRVPSQAGKLDTDELPPSVVQASDARLLCQQLLPVARRRTWWRRRWRWWKAPQDRRRRLGNTRGNDTAIRLQSALMGLLGKERVKAIAPVAVIAHAPASTKAIDHQEAIALDRNVVEDELRGGAAAREHWDGRRPFD